MTHREGYAGAVWRNGWYKVLLLLSFGFGSLVWSSGCGDSGEKVVADGGGDAGTGQDGSWDGGPGVDASVDGGGGSGLSLPMCVWNQAYQENYDADSVTEILAGARSCYVLIDPFDSEDARNAISPMQANGNLVGCYMSVGTCEDWREDFDALRQFCVDKVWDAWEGEYFVDRTDTGILELMEARIDKMAGWGCQMVEFDNMDWAFDDGARTEYGFHATEADARAYIEALCQHARDLGMMCMAKSSTIGVDGFDGMTVESYPENKDWWEKEELHKILDAGRLGVIVHYNEADCSGIYDGYKTEYGERLSFVCEDKNLQEYVHFNE